MIRALPALIPLAMSLLAGCGSSTPTATQASSETTATEAAGPAPTAAASAAPKEDASASAVPTTCTTKGKVCLPPAAFAKKVCDKGNSDVALYMLRKGTPFTRMYLTHDTEAWNASGGASSNDKVLFDEEVVVMVERAAPTGGIVVGNGGGSFDVMRWDGTCVSLQAEELTLTPPPKAKHAKVDFHALTSTVTDVLLQNEAILKTYKERKNECKGQWSGDVSAKCVKLVSQLGEQVYDYVAKGGEVPAPASF
ncbi:MAG: hypothetical protein U0414_23315 [Polyangiaceae bacterium]